MGDFIDEEFGKLDLGDKRLAVRLRSVMERLLDSPQASIKSACRGWAETLAAYRFFNNDAVTPEAIITPHQQAITKRAKSYDEILVIQDTTELDFSNHKHLKGTGPLNYEERRGFLMHTQFVSTADRLPLGIWNTKIFARDDQEFRKNRKQLPIDQKESFRWLEGFELACDLAQSLPDSQVISISDREGDIYEVFEAWQRRMDNQEPSAQLIVRANQDRALSSPSNTEAKQTDHLFDKMRKAREVGFIEFEIKSREQLKKKAGTRKLTYRQGRLVKQRLHVCQVTPRPPHRTGKKLQPVSYWAVLAEEIDPPIDQDPIDWLLLTTIPTTSFEEAKKIISHYLARWDIEVFHRTLKTGCRIENIQLKTPEALLPCLVTYAIVAWRILYLTHLGRHCPELPCGVVFDEVEWKTAFAVYHSRKTKPPSQCNEPSIGEMIRMVASFGGHLGRKGDSPPGAQAMWQGLTRLKDFALGWEMAFTLGHQK